MSGYCRHALFSDIKRLIEIEANSFNGKESLNYYKFWYAINRGTGVILVILDELFSDLSGYIYILNSSKNCARIYSLAVDLHYRQQGFASNLLTISENIYKEKGYHSMRLEVRKSNEKSINLYTKFGYKMNGTKKDYYANNEDALVMIKDLKSELK
jgi:ribosomal-protein-alanine N-acetyltransferase